MTPDFRAIFEATPALYLVLDPELSIVAASDAYLRATMTRREDILGRGLFDVFPDDPADPAATGTRNLRASLERVRTTHAPDTMATQKYDIRRPEAEGGGFEERHWSPVNSPVFDDRGVLTYFLHRVEDVTTTVRMQRRQTEHQGELGRQRAAFDEATRKTNQFLEAVLENIPHMVFVKQASNLAFVRFNRAGEELLGVPRAAIIGKTDRDFFPADEAAFFQAKDRETLRGTAVVDIPEESIQTKRGPRLLHTKKVVIRDAEGAPTYLLGISEDITDRKAAEAALAQKNHELEISARIDRIGARVLLSLNQQADGKRPATGVLRVLADEAGYLPLAFYEHDEWRGGLVFGAGLGLAAGYDERLLRPNEGLVDLARRSGIVVIAEGIETVDERDTLIDLGCDLFQGHLFARPGPSFAPPEGANAARR